MFDSNTWALVPFHFWSAVFFVLGSMVGSLLNVCIHRLPRGESIISPRSRCPHCGFAIPWKLNIPLVTWLYLRGRCSTCGGAVSARYFVVELLTGLTFCAVWVLAGEDSILLALALCVLLAGFIAATFIDFEHFIIPDEITLGGIVVGFLCSALVPELHGVESRAAAVQQSFIGIAAGGGAIYAILRLGKLLFGRQRLQLDPDSRVIFTDTSMQIGDKKILYEEMFYRRSDAVLLEAKHVELIDRCYANVRVRFTPNKLTIGPDEFDPEPIPWMEATTDAIVVPREAMGLGDVKFMAAIGAFLGWKAIVFSLMLSSVLGSLVGVLLILLGKREWSSRIPYGPYIALAATGWVFGGNDFVRWWFAP